jgi:hypothetical protein
MASGGSLVRELEEQLAAATVALNSAGLPASEEGMYSSVSLIQGEALCIG